MSFCGSVVLGFGLEKWYRSLALEHPFASFSDQFGALEQCLLRWDAAETNGVDAVIFAVLFVFSNLDSGMGLKFTSLACFCCALEMNTAP